MSLGHITLLEYYQQKITVIQLVNTNGEKLVFTGKSNKDIMQNKNWSIFLLFPIWQYCSDNVSAHPRK